MAHTRRKVEDYVQACPRCGKKPQLWEQSFYGHGEHKFVVECSNCGHRTNQYVRTESAVSAWNRGQTHTLQPLMENFDSDALISMMSQMMGTIGKDYHRIASKKYLTRYDKFRINELENFVLENPYMLPYDANYIVEEMRRQAEKARKNHGS